MTDVQGNCPMGCGEGLILGEGGQLWCAALLCPKPDAAAQILADTETAHIVTVTFTGFTIRHPLRERLDGELTACMLHAHLDSRDAVVRDPGQYRVTGTPGEYLIWEPLP